ncbi:hypothetical protein U14_04127 [Candidatus Moduliflexus flocculans]|uniref:HicB family protein n=1 Tax=Candidatus Moduliflexus flocculans TaxID=1499966 RepID=A0A0S6W4I1_9BACT|nr:hypothetical protein U14_04127 [Candidatus Moduliflexus flocculans]
MPTNANVLTIRMPADFTHRIGVIAEEQGVSINQLAMYILAKEIGNLEAGHKLSIYWNAYTKEDLFSDFDDVMGKVQNRPVPQLDTMT